MSIPETMKAVVAYAVGDMRLETVNVPQPKYGEILIKVEACGICAGDLKASHGAAKFWGVDGVGQYTDPPFIPGHEFLGHIVAMGEGVEGDFKIGDRVISEQIVPCGVCKFCKTGRHWMCEKHDVYGFRKEVNGGMAEYAIFPKNSLTYHVPDELKIEDAILIEPFACSKHAVDRAGNITQEDVVVLAGAGTLGLGMIGYLRMKNPKALVVLDMREDRLALAKEFGADYALNPAKINLREEINKLTDGYGCDVYIEASGHHLAVKQGLNIIRRMGTYVEFSVFGQEASVDWSIISDDKELDIFGAHLSPYCYEPVMNWMKEGKIPTKGVVTDQFPLDKWEEAFAIADKGENALKVILIP